MLGGLVPVGGVAFGFEDEVEAADVWVAVAVGVPVEFGEVLVAGELADDPVAVEGHVQAPADVVPSRQLRGGHSEPFPELAGAVAEVAVGVAGALEQPGDHDVGVGVVVDALAGPVGVAVVELVGPHDAAQVVPVGGGVVLGQVDPEPGDLHEEFGAVVGEERVVGGDLVVLPHLVRDGQADVVLAAGVVRHPPS